MYHSPSTCLETLCQTFFFPLLLKQDYHSPATFLLHILSLPHLQQIRETAYTNIPPFLILVASNSYGGRHQHITDGPLQKQPGSPPKEPGRAGSKTFHSTSEWLSLPASQISKESMLPASSIPLGQRTPAVPATPSPRPQQKRKALNSMKRTESGSTLPTSKVRRYFPFWNWLWKPNQRLCPS